MCYVMQLPFSRGSALFNGFMRIFEDHRNRLPVAARALKSWSRMGFQKEGAPVPFEAVGSVLYDLFEHGQLYEGAAVLLQLDGWLREQDWGLLRAGGGNSGFPPSLFFSSPGGAGRGRRGRVWPGERRGAPKSP